MGRAMLSKSLIQFSVDGQSCVPSLLFTWGQPMMEVTRIMGTSFKRSHDTLLHSVPPTLQQATDDLCLPRDSWTLMVKTGSLSCGITAPFSWVLVHTVLFLPSKSLFPHSCVSSGGSVVALMATSSKRAYAISRSAASRALTPVVGHW